MELLSQGEGPLLSDPSANAARVVFAAKSHALTDKVTTVREAVNRCVHDSDYLAIGGFGTNRVPVAVCHEIVRQKKQNLSLAGFTGTHTFQILCSGNLTGRGKTLANVDAAYIVGLEARGLSPHARRVMQSGEVTAVEWSNYALALRLKAGAMGVPFLPCRTMLGTDTFRRSAAKAVSCPFTGEPLTLVPALFPDVAAIHVHEADRYGNCRIRGVTVADLDMARAAKRLIVTCERLITTDEIRSDPSRTAIPFFCVDCVCEVPYGGYPSNVAYEYFSDENHLRHWLDVERDLATLVPFLQKYIWEVEDFSDYLQLIGGLNRLTALRRQELFLDLPG
jgi:glutaconate CoA-transferase, subunit A